jgi:hypothetical protein
MVCLSRAPFLRLGSPGVARPVAPIVATSAGFGKRAQAPQRVDLAFVESQLAQDLVVLALPGGHSLR